MYHIAKIQSFYQYMIHYVPPDFQYYLRGMLIFLITSTIHTLILSSSEYLLDVVVKEVVKEDEVVGVVVLVVVVVLLPVSFNIIR